VARYEFWRIHFLFLTVCHSPLLFNIQKIEIQNRGSLENEEVHNSILNLEGCREALKLRMKKYQLIEI